MDFNEPNNYYDILDIRPNASPSEVREAYYRVKSAYNKDSVALYSLIDPAEREEMLNRIEEAYQILSNDENRRVYDRNHGIIETTGIIQGEIADPSRVVSIDRVPPMESFGDDASEELLVAPTTDFQGPIEKTKEMFNPFTPAPAAALTPSHATPPPPPIQNAISRARARTETPEAELAREIATEVEWRGTFLRHVREANSVSIEEMSHSTKLSKTYIIAIEEENFAKLPAPVFVRGFLVQIARILRLPQDKLLEAYLQRFKTAKPDR